MSLRFWRKKRTPLVPLDELDKEAIEEMRRKAILAVLEKASEKLKVPVEELRVRLFGKRGE